MTARRNLPSDSEAKRLLRASAESVVYDVDVGLERHQRLVEEQAALPDWARAKHGSRWPVARKWSWFGLTVLVVTGFVVYGARTPTGPERGSAPLALPPADGAPATAVSDANDRLVEQPAAAAPDQPEPAHEAPVGEPALHATREQQEAPSEKPRAVVVEVQASAPLAHSSPPSQVSEARASPATPAPSRPLPKTTTMPLGEPKGAPSGAAKAPELTIADPEVLEEMEELKQAEQLLVRHPERALSLVRAGLARFRPGYLRQERRYIEIMALHSLGKVEDARLLAKVFVRDYPVGPYRRKVERALSQRENAK